MKVQLPRLLDHQMNELARLQPSHLSVTLCMEPVSTAVMTLPPGESLLQPGDWIELFVPGRSAGIFRAVQVQRDAVHHTQQVRLEHTLAILGDILVPGHHAFFGWDDGDPTTTITGYRVCQDRRSNGAWYSPALTFRNRDGSQVILSFRHGVVLPVIALTDQGWRIPVTQQLIDAAWHVSGVWDGSTVTGVISSDYLAACTPYSHAVGTVTESCDTYRKPVRYADGYTAEGWVTAGTGLTVHALCSDASGSFYAAAYTDALGQTITTFVPVEHVTLDSGSVIGGETETAANHFAQVADALFAAAHWQDTGWVFGESDFTERFGYVFENTTLLDALLSLPDRLPEPYMWQTDQHTLPWRLNLRRLSDDDLAELRLSRNLTELSMSIDAADVVNCVLPVGADGLTVEAVNSGSPYVMAEDADKPWHAEQLLYTNDATPQALYETALAYLRRHHQPVVSIAISAMELSQLTGEPLDVLTLGKTCRLPLPEEKQVVTEIITQLTWPDVYAAPERVQVTLANRPDTASTMLAKMMRK